MDYQKLFDYMHREHNTILLEQDMKEIVLIVNEMQQQALLQSDVSGSFCDYCKDDRTAVCCQTCLDEMINHTANTQRKIINAER